MGRLMELQNRLYDRLRHREAFRAGAEPRVRLAPCSVRGKPLGPSAEGRARVLPAQAEERAEAALRANYGLGRQLYERTAGSLGDAVYLEILPGGDAA